jgi:SAM-dependent methyltransferase
MPEQRFSFDAVAELYDRARPRYPEALVDELVSHTALAAGARVLELGCGTGQLTAALARRDLRVLALEPGPNTAAVAREKLAAFPAVEVVCSTFEAWPLEPSAFELVVSAQAFHWITPDLRFAKSADALSRGGHLAIVGNCVVGQELRAELDAVYARLAPALSGGNAMNWYARSGPIPELFAASGCFGPLTWRCHPWSKTYPARDYLDLLSTHSDHVLISQREREILYAAIGAVIADNGGSLRVDYEAHLYLAPKPR